MKDFSHCHRKYYHAYIQGLQLIEPGRAIRLGSLASLILGMLRSESHQNRVEEYKQFIYQKWLDTLDKEDPDSLGDLDLIRMKAIFDAYIALGMHEPRGITEYEFRWTDLDYPEIHGYLDLAIPSLREAEEFKYTSNASYYDKFAMEEQLCSYFIGAPGIDTYRVTCIIPPKLRLKEDERLSQYYQRIYDDVLHCHTTFYFIRQTYYRSEFNLEQYKIKARMIAEEIMQYAKMTELNPDPMYYFYQNKQACHSPFECEFIDICRSGVLPENLFKKRGTR
jgi:hypothetical protein